MIIAGRREDLLQRIVLEHPGMGSLIMDVSDGAAVSTGFAWLTAEYPDLNDVVNNAGIMLSEDLADPAHLEVAEQTVATNLLGPIRVLNAAVPFLVAKADATIINVSSGLAFVPLPMTPTYCATKAAIHSFTQSLRVQLSESRVQVVELIPPGVQTDLMGQAAAGRGMPLPAFLDEVMGLLAAEPDAPEICVDEVRLLRDAETEGRHDDALAMVSGAH